MNVDRKLGVQSSADQLVNILLILPRHQTRAIIVLNDVETYFQHLAYRIAFVALIRVLVFSLNHHFLFLLLFHADANQILLDELI